MASKKEKVKISLIVILLIAVAIFLATRDTSKKETALEETTQQGTNITAQTIKNKEDASGRKDMFGIDMERLRKLKSLGMKMAKIKPRPFIKYATVGDTSYVGRLNKFRAVDKSGKVKWEFASLPDSGNKFIDSSGKKVFILTFDATVLDSDSVLRALQEETGQVIWKFRINESNVVVNISKEVVHVKSRIEEIGELYKLSALTGKVIWSRK